MAYAYSLIVRAPDRSTLDSAEKELTFDFAGHKVKVEAFGGAQLINSANWLRFSCRVFATEQAAQDHGQMLKKTLRLACVKTRFALDVGSDTVISHVGKTTIDQLADQGIQALPAVHGLLVYRATGNDIQFFGSGNVTRTAATSRYLQAIDEVTTGLDANLDKRLETACDLFILASFESSPRARFLTYVSALEALVVQLPLDSRELVSVVAEIERHFEARVSETTAPKALVASLQTRIAQLKIESISMAVQRTAASNCTQLYGGKSPADFAKHVYDLRSRMSHGEVADASTLPISDTARFVADIILSMSATKA